MYKYKYTLYIGHIRSQNLYLTWNDIRRIKANDKETHITEKKQHKYKIKKEEITKKLFVFI